MTTKRTPSTMTECPTKPANARKVWVVTLGVYGEAISRHRSLEAARKACDKRNRAIGGRAYQVEAVWASRA
jgi:hypothetical protein